MARPRLDKEHLSVGGAVVRPAEEWRARTRLLDLARQGDRAARCELWLRYRCRVIVPEGREPELWDAEARR